MAGLVTQSGEINLELTSRQYKLSVLINLINYTGVDTCGSGDHKEAIDFNYYSVYNRIQLLRALIRKTNICPAETFWLVSPPQNICFFPIIREYLLKTALKLRKETMRLSQMNVTKSNATDPRAKPFGPPMQKSKVKVNKANAISPRWRTTP